MHIDVVPIDEVAFGKEAACLLLPVPQGGSVACELLTDANAAVLRHLQTEGIFTGNAQEVVFVPSADGAHRGAALLGLGEKPTAETVRRGAGACCAALKQYKIRHVVVDAQGLDPAQAAACVDGLMLGQYKYTAQKSEAKDEVVVERVTIAVVGGEVDRMRAECEHAARVCTHANWARDLAHTPSNELTPAMVAETAQAIAKEYGGACEVLNEDQLHKLGMNALLAVARGSDKRATMSILKYHHADNAKTVAIVGKGVTFDSGGISLKPGEGMHEMKYDMCGAAAVLGAMKAVYEMKPPMNVVGVVPSVENMPGPAAMTPGEIVRAYNGKTIEIYNTDAEGRLILCDAVAYTVDVIKPAAIVDLATLTGAALVAMGHFGAPAMGEDALVAALQSAGERVGERIWPFPLWDDYSKLIEGTHADICNIGPPKMAGTIVGGVFLKQFVGDTPWAHLDIAGTAWGMTHVPYYDANSATGFGVRLLAEWIRCGA